MWFLALTLFVFAKDVAGEIDCDEYLYDQCQRPQLFDEIPREVEVFKAICPELPSYINCRRDYDAKCEKEDRRWFPKPELYEELHDLFEQICKEGTSLNEDMINNLKCLNETFSNTNCGEQTEDFLKPYEEEVPLDEFRTTHVIPERVHCLSQLILVHCVVEDIVKNCGYDALLLTAEVVRGTEFIDASCPLSYRTDLLEDLDEFNLTEEQKEFATDELLRMKSYDDL